MLVRSIDGVLGRLALIQHGDQSTTEAIMSEALADERSAEESIDVGDADAGDVGRDRENRLSVRGLEERRAFVFGPGRYVRILSPRGLGAEIVPRPEENETETGPAEGAEEEDDLQRAGDANAGLELLQRGNSRSPLRFPEGVSLHARRDDGDKNDGEEGDKLSQPRLAAPRRKHVPHRSQPT